jgi:hypothetical protein
MLLGPVIQVLEACSQLMLPVFAGFKSFDGLLFDMVKHTNS